MAKFRRSFELLPSDIEMIEQALRREIAANNTLAGAQEQPQRIRDLNGLLGKLHNQKVFYAQVHDTGTPAG
ncbi:MAG: hypothetical protein AAF384_00710 [Pseudomonadota bacterium]